jgi:hypothetical protein
MLLACGAAAWSGPAAAQAQTLAGCGANGYRVFATRWDVVLGIGLELRQDCAHPEWPARMVVIGSTGTALTARNVSLGTNEAAPSVQPLLVHAGDRVRLWSQDEMVRIEMSGVVEQSARSGERVVVQITRQNDESGTTVERIAGTVRGAGDVEMER